MGIWPFDKVMSNMSTDAMPFQTHTIDFEGDALNDLRREWLLTNGTGAFALGSVPNINTRRYSGLFIAAMNPPVGRVVALNQMLEQLWLDPSPAAKPIEFSSNQFRDNVGRDIQAPQGHTMLEMFERGLSVKWSYRYESVTFTRELFLHWKQQAITLRYVIQGLDAAALGKDGATLRLSPMLTLRDFHSLLSGDVQPTFDVKGDGQTVTVKRDDVAVTFQCSSGSFSRDPNWWFGVHYPIDTSRGQDDMENLFVPGGFVLKLNGKAEHEFTVTAALGGKPVQPQCDTRARMAHLQPVADHIGKGPTSDGPCLAVAADDFVVDRAVAGKKLSTILAGYPWFADWGRDTFIALPGLLLDTGRHEEARNTLHAFANSIKNGLVPNRFDDYDEGAAHYNTVDGSLWFIIAALRYVEATNDRDSWKDWLCDACQSIVQAYIKGTDYSIKMAGDGLIAAGSMDTQLTWMDAACGGRVFTPRPGKCVEINALWYNALLGLAQVMDDEDKQAANHYTKLAKRVNRAFARVFWDEELNYLRDHTWTDDHEAEHADRSLRPNQIFAASLPHNPLPLTKCKQVVKAVRDKLLTPFGLRTLPPDHVDYHGHYLGPQMQRDEAYHQGTVWPWLIGPYAEAVLRTGKFSDAAKTEALAAIKPLLDMMAGEGPYGALGQLYEIHEASPPYRPVGCMAQAWSISEVLRVWRMIG